MYRIIKRIEEGQASPAGGSAEVVSSVPQAKEQEMEITPLNDRVLVIQEDAPDKAGDAGIIIVPDTVKKPPLQGKVTAVGSGAILIDGSRRELDLAVGDTVIFSEHAATPLDLGEAGLVPLSMVENDIHAKLVDGKIVPLNDRLLVKRDGVKEKTETGLFIPIEAQEPPLQGEVLAVGSGALLQDGRRRKLDVEPGNRVLFNKYAGAEIEFDGETYIILTERDIHAKCAA